MEYLLNSSEMHQCDSDTIRQIGIPSLVLMERAALAVVEEMQNHNCDMRAVLVVCGSGNNGGDGFAIARLLQEQGVQVTAAFVGREESLSEEAACQKQICEKCGIKISSNFTHREYTTIVDAVFGTGLSRNVQGRYCELIDWINQQPSAVVAVDIPSGISADTGRIMGTAVRADLTVTFAYRKIGQILYPGTEYCGEVIRRDIGIKGERLNGALPRVFTYGREDFARISGRRPYSNKGTYGKVLMIAGSEGMSGAACLSALAAYRCGCGLVRVFTPECNRAVIQQYLPEAIVTTWSPGVFPEEQLARALAWSDVAGIGPGLGTSDEALRLLEYLLGHYNRPTVIDADGLNILAGHPELLDETDASVILTPHIGEMMRLTDNTKEEVLEDILLSARQFAREYHVICVLKDARTIVSDGTRMYVNTSGNSGMATGGAGDVLTGVICGLLAQRMTPFDAASLGVYVHGLAGDLACRKCGAYGMLARDIAENLGEILKYAQPDVPDRNAGSSSL